MQILAGTVHAGKSILKEFTMEPSQLVGVRVVFEDGTGVEMNVAVDTREMLVNQFVGMDDDHLDYVRIAHFFGPDDTARIFACATSDIKYIL